MKSFSFLLPVLFSLTFLLEVGHVSACGESLYRVGRGISYRDYSAPLPANIVVFNVNESATAMAAQLAKAGHSVTIIRSIEELEITLRQGNNEVLIAPLDKVVALNAEGLDSSIRLLPLVDGDPARIQQARVLFGRSVSTGDNLRSLLKSVHLTLRDA